MREALVTDDVDDGVEVGWKVDGRCGKNGMCW